MGGARVELRSHNHSGGSSSPSELIIEEIENSENNIRGCGSGGEMDLPMHLNGNGGMLPHYAMIHQGYHQQPQDLSHISAYENGHGHHPQTILRSPYASNLHYSNNNNNHANNQNINNLSGNPLPPLPEGCHAVVKYESPSTNMSETPISTETHIKDAKINKEQVKPGLYFIFSLAVAVVTHVKFFLN